MSPKALRKLKAVQDVVWREMDRGHQASDIIALLVRDYGAKLTLRPETNSLRAGGVVATCTWSSDSGLLDAWRRNASNRIIMAHQS